MFYHGRKMAPGLLRPFLQGKRCLGMSRWHSRSRNTVWTLLWHFILMIMHGCSSCVCIQANVCMCVRTEWKLYFIKSVKKDTRFLNVSYIEMHLSIKRAGRLTCCRTVSRGSALRISSTVSPVSSLHSSVRSKESGFTRHLWSFPTCEWI